ncbi:MAG: hypothetical protein AMXMBFR55_16970 [Gemmatimonadota bacterium]
MRALLEGGEGVVAVRHRGWGTVKEAARGVATKVSHTRGANNSGKPQSYTPRRGAGSLTLVTRPGARGGRAPDTSRGTTARPAVGTRRR